MGESRASIHWQETVDLAVSRLESQTGLALAGLSQMEITVRVRRWMMAKAGKLPPIADAAAGAPPLSDRGGVTSPVL